MEWTKPYIVGSPPFKADEVADNVNDVGGIKDTLYGLSVDLSHIMQN